MPLTRGLSPRRATTWRIGARAAARGASTRHRFPRRAARLVADVADAAPRSASATHARPQLDVHAADRRGPRQLPPRHSVAEPVGPARRARHRRRRTARRDPVEMADRSGGGTRVDARLAAAASRADAPTRRHARERRQPVPALAARALRRARCRGSSRADRGPRGRAHVRAVRSATPPTRRVTRARGGSAGRWRERVRALRRVRLAELRALVDRARRSTSAATAARCTSPRRRGRPSSGCMVRRCRCARRRGATRPFRPRPSSSTTLSCRPCDQRDCVPGDFRCLTTLLADSVVAAAERVLAHRPGRIDIRA